MKNNFSRRRFISKTGKTIAAAGTVMTLPGYQVGTHAQEAPNSMMSNSEINPAEFGKSLRGLGFNLLVNDIAASIEFSKNILLAEVFYSDADFAIIKQGNDMWMLHGDNTYHSNPLAGFVKGIEGRGQGIELRLYDLDPDDAEKRAIDAGHTMLAGSANKPHGLRECYILDPDGYCWVASRPLTTSDA